LDLLTPVDKGTTSLRNRRSYDAASYSRGTELSIVNAYYSFEFFYVLLTVHLSIILIIDQLNAQILLL